MSELTTELIKRLSNLYNMGQLSVSDIELALKEAEQNGFANGQVHEFEKRKPDLIELGKRRANDRALDTVKRDVSETNVGETAASAFDLESETKRIESERLSKAAKEAIVKEVAAKKARTTHTRHVTEAATETEEEYTPAPNVEGIGLPIVDEPRTDDSWKTAVARANRSHGFNDEAERPEKLDERAVALLVEKQMKGQL